MFSFSLFFLHFFQIFSLFFQYIIPISVILVTHTQIIGIVRQRTQAATSFRHSNRADVTIRKNRKTTQILLIIALMFGAHWLPYHIYTIGECFSSMGTSINDVPRFLAFLTYLPTYVPFGPFWKKLPI